MAAKGPHCFLRLLLLISPSTVSTWHTRNNTSVWLDKFQGLPLFSTFNSKWTQNESADEHRFPFFYFGQATGGFRHGRVKRREWWMWTYIDPYVSFFKGREREKKKSLSQPSLRNENSSRYECDVRDVKKAHPFEGDSSIGMDRQQQRTKKKNSTPKRESRNIWLSIHWFARFTSTTVSTRCCRVSSEVVPGTKWENGKIPPSSANYSLCVCCIQNELAALDRRCQCVSIILLAIETENTQFIAERMLMK